jgi:hypothetical protein
MRPAASALLVALVWSAGLASLDAWGADNKKESSMESLKRRVPKPPPVTLNGTRYEVLPGARTRGFPQSGGIIAAFDESSGRELWTLLVYPVVFETAEEEDVQEVYITNLAVSPDHKRLLVENERGKHFEVDLALRAVMAIP